MPYNRADLCIVTQYIEGSPRKVNQLFSNIENERAIQGSLNVHEDIGLIQHRYPNWSMRDFNSYEKFQLPIRKWRS